MQIIQLIIEVAIFLLLLHVAFLKSYFQEKGKNLATKEDISRITDLVESVKSRLQFSLQAKINLKREEHDAVMAYYAALSTWLHSISNCKFSDVSYEKIDCLNVLQQQLDEMNFSTKVAFAKMEVLAKNNELMKAAHDLQLKILEFHYHIVMNLPKYALLCIKIQQAKIDESTTNGLEKYKEAEDEKIIFYRQFNSEKLDLYKSLLPEVNKHRYQISAHLIAISET